MINVIFNEFDGADLVPRLKETFEKYCQILQWGRRHPTRFIEDFFNMELLDHQKWILMNSWCPSTVVWCMSRSSGKAEVLYTPVFSAISDRGEKYPRKTIGDLKVGDKIYDADGKLTEVIHLNPIIFEKVYEVEFEDGEVIECNGEHLWYVHDRGFDRYNKYGGDKWVLRTTDFIYNNFDRAGGKAKEKGHHDYRFHVPLTKPIEYPSYERLYVNPYNLGVFLGDGTSANGQITSSKEDVEEMMSLLKGDCKTISCKPHKDKPNCYTITLDKSTEIKEKYGEKAWIYQKDSFRKRLDRLGVLNNKHIPDRYMYASVEDRLALVQGMCDTDGYVDETGHCEFTQKDKHLFDQFCQLLGSLGIDYSVNFKEHTGYIKKDGTEAFAWRCYFITSKERPTFRLKRKYDKLPDKPIRNSMQKAIINVRKTDRVVPMRCITVSNKSGLYLCGEHYTVTHNSFLVSPLMMARAVLFPRSNTYVMSVTGSQAQETFSKMENVAKNNIASVIGVSSVFLDECVRQNAKADPFTHDKNSFHVELYNGSTINTLNSVAKNVVGIRSYMP